MREPMLAFIMAFGGPLPGISRHFVADPRPSGGSMFRIFRDTRFARDKSPYKTNVGAQFRHAAAPGTCTPRASTCTWSPAAASPAPASGTPTRWP